MDDESKICDDEDIVNESRRKSEIWNYFSIVSSKDWVAKCKQCNSTLSFRSSISNLKKHLIRKHGDIYGEMKVSDDENREEEEETVEEITYLEDDEDAIAETNISYDKRKILRNGAWEYFEVADEHSKMATCTLCQEQFSYRTTSTNLAKHLKRRHCIEFEKVTVDEYVDKDIEEVEIDGEDGEDDVDDGSDDDKDTSTDKRRSKSSIAWDFFSIKDPIKRVATCNLCACEFSYLTSVSNLMKHVRKRHGVRHSLGDSRCYEEEDSKRDLRSGARSSIWLYFKCVDPAAKISVCLICRKQLSHLTSITNLKKHLLRKHPGVQLQIGAAGKEMMIASDGQLYEVESGAKREPGDLDDSHDASEPMELNAIYLDDYGATPRPRAKRQRTYLDETSGDVRAHSEDEEVMFHKNPSPQSEPMELNAIYLDDYGATPRPRAKRQRTYLDETSGDVRAHSEDEEVMFHKKYVRKKSDSLDQFGKYLVSLLRQLPKEMSNQLQVDFVKQVMCVQKPASDSYTLEEQPPASNDDVFKNDTNS